MGMVRMIGNVIISRGRDRYGQPFFVRAELERFMTVPARPSPPVHINSRRVIASLELPRNGLFFSMVIKPPVVPLVNRLIFTAIGEGRESAEAVPSFICKTGFLKFDFISYSDPSGRTTAFIFSWRVKLAAAFAACCLSE
jgi:hypothetical protein